MDLPTLDFAAARDHMVDGQLRPNRITDPKLLRALRDLPRERFLPPALRNMAYIDEDLRLPSGRAFIEPLIIAHLVQLARIRGNERTLVVGAGAGYGAALLDACGATVTALEDDPALLEAARATLPQLAPRVTIVEGRLTAGLPGPWDVILIEGAIPALPPVIGDQLNPHGGRLVTVIAEREGLGHVVLAEPINPGAPKVLLRAQPFGDCATPYLAEFLPPPTFRF